MKKETKNKSGLSQKAAADKKIAAAYKKSSVKSGFKLAGNIIYNALFLLILLITLNALIGTISRRQPFIFGYSVAQVLSESMAADGFYKNDYIVARKVKEASELKIANPETGERGDIITFYVDSNRKPILNGQDRSDSRVLFHEIIGITKEGNFITKGSSNPSADPYEIPFEAVSGKYVKTGTIVDFLIKAILADNRFLYWAIGVLILIVLRQILTFFYSLKDLKLQNQVLKGKRNFLDKKCLEKNIYKDFTDKQKKKLIAEAPEGLKVLYEYLLYMRITKLSDEKIASKINGKRCSIGDVLNFTYSKEPDSEFNIDEYVEKLPKKKKKFEKYSNTAQFKRESKTEMSSAVSLFFGSTLFLGIYLVLSLMLNYFPVAVWYEIVFATALPVLTLLYLYLVYAENKGTAIKLKAYLGLSAELPDCYQFVLQPESFSDAEIGENIAEIKERLSVHVPSAPPVKEVPVEETTPTDKA